MWTWGVAQTVATYLSSDFGCEASRSTSAASTSLGRDLQNFSYESVKVLFLDKGTCQAEGFWKAGSNTCLIKIDFQLSLILNQDTCCNWKWYSVFWSDRGATTIHISVVQFMDPGRTEHLPHTRVVDMRFSVLKRDERSSRYITFQLCNALTYIHDQGVSRCNLKPEVMRHRNRQYWYNLYRMSSSPKTTHQLSKWPTPA